MFQNDAKSREAMAAWLTPFEWQWWMTGTFDYSKPLLLRRKDGSSYPVWRGKMTPLAAIGTFERFIKYWSKGEAFYFVVAECRSFLHVHALVGGVGDLIPFRIMKRWEYNYGFARIQRYDRSLGAAHYIVKDLGSEKFEWGFSLPNLKGGTNDNEVREGLQ